MVISEKPQRAVLDVSFSGIEKRRQIHWRFSGQKPAPVLFHEFNPGM